MSCWDSQIEGRGPIKSGDNWWDSIEMADWDEVLILLCSSAVEAILKGEGGGGGEGGFRQNHCELMISSDIQHTMYIADESK